MEAASTAEIGVLVAKQRAERMKAANPKRRARTLVWREAQNWVMGL